MINSIRALYDNGRGPSEAVVGYFIVVNLQGMDETVRVLDDNGRWEG